MNDDAAPLKRKANKQKQSRKNAKRSSPPRRRNAKQRQHPMAISFALGIAIGVAVCAAAAVIVLLRTKSAVIDEMPSEQKASTITQPTSPAPAPKDTPKESAPKQNTPPRTSTSAPLERGASIPPIAAFPAAASGAKLAVVLDDAGGDLKALRHCLALPFPVTIAVMPGLAHSRECADEARKAGREVLLHQPMQAQNLSIKPGPLAIMPDMTADEAARLVTRNIALLGGVAGVNNHEGSLITEDTAVMAAIMKTAQSSGAYFLDSRTTSSTRVGDASAATGVPYYERDVFLDNSHDKQAIIEQVRRALSIADRDGAAIMIGHVRADDALVDTLFDIAPQLQEAGYTFCTVSQSGALRGQ